VPDGSPRPADHEPLDLVGALKDPHNLSAGPDPPDPISPKYALNCGNDSRHRSPILTVSRPPTGLPDTGDFQGTIAEVLDTAALVHRQPPTIAN
jgi:hypothetical protein